LYVEEGNNGYRDFIHTTFTDADLEQAMREWIAGNYPSKNLISVDVDSIEL
jgi:hypothetical protein